MTLKVGIVMDPIAAINFKKDATLAMCLAAQARGWALYYMEMGDVFVRDGVPYGHVSHLQVRDDAADWFSLRALGAMELSDLDVILMRKDPPFDMEYIYATYVLERAELSGVLVVNKPQSIRDANEKLFTAWFPQCCPPTLVARRMDDIKAFVEEQGEIVVKPLDGMGGMSIFRLGRGEPNTNVILETLTRNGRRFAMAQRFIDQISHGDKRVLLVDGEPVPYALARVPSPSDFRGNLAAGATGEGRELDERDRWICAEVGPELRERGLIFVGLDIIGEYLTEINVTSPTCIRELDAIYSLDIAGQLMDAIAARVDKRGS